MTPAQVQARRWIWVEHAFAMGVISLLARAMWVLWTEGYLPQPFFYEPSDTFMDWFNTAYWAHDPGAYDSWLTIYPPLSFVVLRLLSKSSCYTGAEGLPARDCDWVGLAAIHVIFIINIILIALTYTKSDRRTALPRAIALSVGMPMLFALERGNLLLLCFTTFVLAFGPLIRSARLRWVFAGLAVNFKVYLIATIATQLLRRRWMWTEGALMATLVIYLLSYGLLGAGTPIEIFSNIREFSGEFIAAQVLDIWYSVTYRPLISLLEGESFPISSIVGSQLADIGLVVLPALMMTGQGAIIIAAIAAWRRPEAVSPHRLALLGTALALITSEAGGYTEILLLFFVFLESWKGLARPIAISLAYLLCLPGDIVLGWLPPISRFSYLAGHSTEIEIGVGLGVFLRPGMVIGIAVSLACATVADVWRQRSKGGREIGGPCTSPVAAVPDR